MICMMRIRMMNNYHLRAPVHDAADDAAAADDA